MRMNRRNVLAGIGALTAGGGAIFGSGAFSSVSAERTVEVSTAGDSNAYLGIDVDSSYAVNTGDGVTAIDLGDSSSSSGFNDEAETTISGVLTLTHNAQDGSTIAVGFDDGDGNFTSNTTVNLSEADVTFELASTTDTNETKYQFDSGSDSVGVNVTVDTTASNESAGTTGNLTILAKDQ